MTKLCDISYNQCLKQYLDLRGADIQIAERLDFLILVCKKYHTESK